MEKITEVTEVVYDEAGRPIKTTTVRTIKKGRNGNRK